MKDRKTSMQMIVYRDFFCCPKFEMPFFQFNDCSRVLLAFCASNGCTRTTFHSTFLPYTWEIARPPPCTALPTGRNCLLFFCSVTHTAGKITYRSWEQMLQLPYVPRPRWFSGAPLYLGNFIYLPIRLALPVLSQCSHSMTIVNKCALFLEQFQCKFQCKLPNFQWAFSIESLSKPISAHLPRHSA